MKKLSERLPDLLYGVTIGLLICLGILFLTSCDTTAPDINVTLKTKYGIVRDGDTIAKGENLYVDYTLMKDECFRWKTTYTCCYDSLSSGRSYFPMDTLWWCKDMDVTLTVLGWDNNGNSNYVTRWFKVR